MESRSAKRKVSHSRLFRYGGAMVLLGVATLLRLLLYPVLGGEASFHTYFGAMFVAAWLFGTGPGLFTFLGGAALAVWLFIPAASETGTMLAPEWIELGLSLGFSLFSLFLFDKMRRNRFKAETSERRFSRLLEAGSVGIALVDQRGVRYANTPLLHLLGYSADEVRAGELRWERIVAKESGYHFEGGISGLEESGSGLRPCMACEKEYVAKDRRRIPVLVSLVPLERFPDKTDLGAMFVTDLSKIKETEKELRESEASFRKVVESVPDILYRAGVPSYEAKFISPAIEPLLGFKPEEWRAEPALWQKQLYADDRERVIRESEAALASNDQFTVAYRLWHKDGKKLSWIEDRVHVERDEAGHPFEIFGSMVDITHRMRAEEALHQRQQEFRALADLSPDLVMRFDGELKFRYVNQSIEKYSGQRAGFYIEKRVRETGWPPEMISSLTNGVKRVFATGAETRLTYRYVAPENKVFYFDTRLVPEFAENKVVTVIAVSRDITRQYLAEERIRQKARELRKANKRLHALSRQDELTGLANRRYLFNYVQSEWRRERRHGDPISLIMADIDMFKAYNDRYGHLAGDECLREIAVALRSQLRRPGDLLARYGGEEFAVVLPETSVNGAAQLAERMRLAVESLHLAHEGSLVAPYVTVSLGVAAGEPKRQSPEELIGRADQALYHAKSAGRNRLYSA